MDEQDLWPNRHFVTASLIVRTEFLQQHPDLVKRFLRAHVELSRWINKDPDETKRILNAEIRGETGKALSPDVLNDAFSRLEVTFDPMHE